MKNHILTFIILLFFSDQSFAQINAPINLKLNESKMFSASAKSGRDECYGFGITNGPCACAIANEMAIKECEDAGFDHCEAIKKKMRYKRLIGKIKCTVWYKGTHDQPEIDTKN